MIVKCDRKIWRMINIGCEYQVKEIVNELK